MERSWRQAGRGERTKNCLHGLLWLIWQVDPKALFAGHSLRAELVVRRESSGVGALGDLSDWSLLLWITTREGRGSLQLVM